MPWLVLVVVPFLLSGCPGPGPIEVPKKASGRLHAEILPVPSERVRSAIPAALERGGLERIASREEDRVVTAGERMRPATPEEARRMAKRLNRIAELEESKLPPRLRAISEVRIGYRVDVKEAGSRRTRLETLARIEAIDRSQGMITAIGIMTVPRSFELPSTGAAERELLFGIADEVLLAEEVLYHVGQLGRD